jgi:CubicO group peptidase (beta-lactamase class C family)
MRSLLIVLTLLALFAPALHAQSQAGWPTRGWKTATPEAQGVDVGPLDALDGEFASGNHGYIDGMLVVRNGYLVFERSYTQDYDRLFDGRGEPGQYNYYDPRWHPYYQNGSLHTMQSVSKSVTSALIGIAIRRREIPGVGVKVKSYFEGYDAPDDDPRRRAMTLRDLLTMTSGIRWDESTVTYTDPRNSCARMEQSDDWVRFVVSRPMEDAPGRTFVYNSGVTMLLEHILWSATGRHADVYAKEHLFGPLGIDDFHWKRTPTGHTDTEGGLYLAPRDLARIGYLYQNDGIWEGQRILPESWVRATMSPAVDVSTSNDWKYGYQWWLLPYEGGTTGSTDTSGGSCPTREETRPTRMQRSATVVKGSSSFPSTS